MTVRCGRQRLFFALWPDEGVRQQLADVARKNCECPVAIANLHMTLIFLGWVDDRQRACFCQAATGVQGRPFELYLDRLKFWKRHGIQWIGSGQEVPQALPELVRSLGESLHHCGFKADKRDFIPHVTLSRKAKAKKPGLIADVDLIHWKVQDYVLAESVPVDRGVIYRVLQRWPLG